MLYRAVLTIVPNFIVIHETTVAETAWSFYTGHCKGQEPYLNLFNLTNEKERSPVILGLPSSPADPIMDYRHVACFIPVSLQVNSRERKIQL